MALTPRVVEVQGVPSTVAFYQGYDGSEPQEVYIRTQVTDVDPSERHLWAGRLGVSKTFGRATFDFVATAYGMPTESQPLAMARDAALDAAEDTLPYDFLEVALSHGVTAEEAAAQLLAMATLAVNHI